MNSTVPISRNSLVILLFFVVSSIMAVMIALYNTRQGQRDSQRAVDHTHNVLFLLEQVQAGALVVESSARGYVIAGDSGFLSQFEENRLALLSRLQKLRRLTSDNQLQQKRLSELQQLVSAKVSFANALILSVNRHQPKRAVEMTRSRRGVDLGEKIAHLIQGLQGEERRLLSVRQKNNNSSIFTAIVLVVALGAIAMLMLISAIVLISRSLRAAEKAERAAFENGKFLESTLNTISDGILVTDIASNSLSMHNKAAERMLGELSGVNDLGSFCGELLVKDPETQQVLGREENPVCRALEGNCRDEQLVRIDRENGPLYLNVTADRFEGRAGSTYAVVGLHDITQQRRFHEQLLELNQELDAFAYSVSHDLRAPLRSINGFTRILLDNHSSQLDQEGKRISGIILRNVDKMGRLIDDLLDFSRVGKKDLLKEPINMRAFFESLAREVSNREGKPAVQVEISEMLPAFGDPELIKVVITNLLSNAIKYSAKQENPKIWISCEKVAGETVYTIRDNGVGFNMVYYDKLFEVFQRLHNPSEYEGTGVGLALVQRIVARHGGRVWAKSSPGEGATFNFSLPALKELSAENGQMQGTILNYE